MNQKSTVSSRRLMVGGRVQGVGFRPFVYRLARELGVRGQVSNVAGQVDIIAQAPAEVLDDFQHRLVCAAPPLARPEIRSVESAEGSFEDFRILQSEGGPRDIHVPPDHFACPQCLEEMTTEGERRYRYPFINCTQCGPRYTIIRAMPYDRPNTAMDTFRLCQRCESEYTNPLDRRFHAQPLACPHCGPELRYVRDELLTVGNERALADCVEDLRHGAIIAIRGIGGYHLVCNATDEDVVARLRTRKHRPVKPLAVMVPWSGTDGLDHVRTLAEPSANQSTALTDPTRPIVLTSLRPDTALAPSIAPGLHEVGIMLPYSPLHHLLLDAFGAPLVATSANISGEPVITDTDEVVTRLLNVADGFLHHNRPIVRPADDPVMRETAGVVHPVRLGRGNAPLELRLPFELQQPTLAAGAFLKNTVALAWEDRVIVAPHIGDLGSRRSRLVFQQVVADLQALYGIEAEHIVCDAHPDYPNSRWARDSGLPFTRVYHHHAHASALAGELGIDRPMIVFTWDGLGLGEDGTLWGGEALAGRPGDWHRVASFRQFRLPGGDRVVLEPWRTALSLVWESGLDRDLPLPSLELLHQAWESGINSPLTSAVGRLFDAAAVFSGLLESVSYEGEAPARLEAAARGEAGDVINLPIAKNDQGLWCTDWLPLIDYLNSAEAPPTRLAATFQATMARSLCRQAELLCGEHHIRDVGLCGGVFQNRHLTEIAVEQLTASGLNVHLPTRLPVNDAAISFGQIIEAGSRWSTKR